MSGQRNTKTKRAKTELAQFFTPKPVAACIWEVVQSYLGKDEWAQLRVIDPAAGEGIFLDVVASGHKVAVEHIYGIEIDAKLVDKVVNKTQFFSGDGLVQDFPGVQSASFDVVIGNPPFGRVRDVVPQLYREMGSQWAEQFSVWRAGAGAGNKRRLNHFPIEVLFVERALQLARPGGLIAFIMPEGFLTNDRLQRVRDWILDQADLLATIALPDAVFQRPGVHAKTAVVVLRKKGGAQSRRRAALMVQDQKKGPLEQAMEDILQYVRAAQRGRKGKYVMRIPALELWGRRWDVQYWRGRQAGVAIDRRFALVALGDYIEHLTYGPIVTGRKPRHEEAGIRVIRQGDFAETGLCLEEGLRVATGGVYDPQRSRVQEGDLLLPRSGAGALGRNRLAVYLEDEPANIGCFVDRLRLRGLNPFFAWFFFKTEPGWQQIRALINGVGTPNINFSEIRSLRLPLIPEETQEYLEERYRREVWPLHCRRSKDEIARQRSEECFKEIIAELSRFTCGQIRSLG